MKPNFFQIPYFRFFSHVLIWVFVILNSFLHIQNFILQKKNTQAEQILEQTRQENQSFLDKDDYYNSELYRIKSYKEEGLQLIGEKVINPLVKEELFEGENGQFIPDLVVKETGNLQKWQDCFWGGQNLPKNQQTQQNHLNSACKIR